MNDIANVQNDLRKEGVHNIPRPTNEPPPYAA